MDDISYERLRLAETAVRSTARRYGIRLCREDVEDLVSETLLSFFEKRYEQNWPLSRIAHNKTVDHLRNGHRRLATIADLPDTPFHPDRVPDHAELLDLILQSTSKAPRRILQALLDGEELNTSVLAQSTGLTERQVTQYLYKARQQIDKAIAGKMASQLKDEIWSGRCNPSLDVFAYAMTAQERVMLRYKAAFHSQLFIHPIVTELVGAPNWKELMTASMQLTQRLLEPLLPVRENDDPVFNVRVNVCAGLNLFYRCAVEHVDLWSDALDYYLKAMVYYEASGLALSKDTTGLSFLRKQLASNLDQDFLSRAESDVRERARDYWAAKSKKTE